MADPKPYAYKVNRVTISGDCFGGAEIWTTGFFLGAEGADATDPDGLAAEIGPYWASFFSTANSAVSVQYRTLQVKVSQFDANGVTNQALTDYYDFVTPPTGGGGSLAHAAQVSLVATLTSGVTRGAGSKGRMYLPGINSAVGTNGKLATASSQNISLNLKDMFDAINADVDIPGQVILASHGPVTKVMPGPVLSYFSPSNHLVTGLKVGDVLDTQRRRRNGLVEAYSARTLA